MTNECRKMSLLVSRSLDSDLDREETGVLDAHLAACARCRTTRERYAAQSTLLDAAFSETPLMKGIMTPSGSRHIPVPRNSWRAGWRWGVAGAVAVVIVAMLLPVVTRRSMVVAPAVVLESIHPSTMVLPLSSIIYYEDCTGRAVHSQFVKIALQQPGAVSSTVQERLNLSCYDSPLFTDSYEIDPVAMQAGE